MVNTKQFWTNVRKQYLQYCLEHDLTKTITICQTSHLFEDAWDSFTLKLEIQEFASKFLSETGKRKLWLIGNVFLFDTTKALRIEYNLNSTDVRKEFLDWMVKQKF